MAVLYHSPLTRWLIILAGGFAGLMIAGGPDPWRDTPLMHWLGQAPIPLRAWGVLILVYVVLVAFDSTRPAGYAVGAGLWAIFTIALIATAAQGGPKGALAMAGFVDVTAFHVFSIKTAWAQKLNQP